MCLYNKIIFLLMGPQLKLPASAHTCTWHTCITIYPAIHQWLCVLLGIKSTPFCLYLVQYVDATKMNTKHHKFTKCRINLYKEQSRFFLTHTVLSLLLAQTLERLPHTLMINNISLGCLNCFLERILLHDAMIVHHTLMMLAYDALQCIIVLALICSLHLIT